MRCRTRALRLQRCVAQEKAQKALCSPSLEGEGKLFPPSPTARPSSPWEAQPLSSAHPQGRPCGHPLALAAQQHPRFRDLFDFSKPVLLSGGLYTWALWDSLSQRKAPYGWQGLSRQGNAQPRPLGQPSASACPFLLLLTLTVPWCRNPVFHSSQEDPQAVRLLPYFPAPTAPRGQQEGLAALLPQSSHPPGASLPSKTKVLVSKGGRRQGLQHPSLPSELRCCGNHPDPPPC